MGGQMINVGGHFVSKQAGQLHFGGIHAGGGPPVPPPKPGSKGAGAGGAGGAGGTGGAGGVGGGDHGKGGEGASEWSPLKGWYNFRTKNININNVHTSNIELNNTVHLSK